MMVVYGLIALALISILYLSVSAGGSLWPGGPQLQPEAARNLSISLLVVGLLLCGVMFGSVTQAIVSTAADSNATRVAVLTATAAGATQAADEDGVGGGAFDETGLQAGATETAQALATFQAQTAIAQTGSPPPGATPVVASVDASRTAVAATSTAGAAATSTSAAATAGSIPGVTPTTTATPPQTTGEGGPARPTATPLPTSTPVRPTSTPTPRVPTSTPTASPTATPLPTALPLDPRVLIETVLRSVIERANDAEVEALLSGDDTRVDPLWSGQARDRILENVRRVRSRFLEVTEVNWQPSGEGIRLLSNTVTTATYATSETWTFVGTIVQICKDGEQKIRRYVETYPFEQYTLELKGGQYLIVEWRLGKPIIDSISTACP